MFQLIQEENIMADVQICSACGKQVPSHESYCFSCGHVFPKAAQALATHTLGHIPSTQTRTKLPGTAIVGDKMRLVLLGVVYAVPPKTPLVRSDPLRVLRT